MFTAHGKAKCAIVSLILTAMTGCGKTVSGSVSTDGSTSMEKVIGALGEAFEGNNSGVTFTYNPTGSGSGVTAVAEGRCDIGLSSRNLKDEEKAQGLTETIDTDPLTVFPHPVIAVRISDTIAISVTNFFMIHFLLFYLIFFAL